MSDNAASHDSTNSEVHPDARTGDDSDKQDEDLLVAGGATTESKQEAKTIDDTQPTNNEEAVTAAGPKPPSASPPPAPPSILPPSPPPLPASSKPEGEPESAPPPDITTENAREPLPEDANETNAQSEEPLFTSTTDTADDGEGLDPDTLASIAALSRLQGDDDDDEEDADASGGDHDFSSLAVDSQHMTREQMHDLVARLAQGDDQDGDGEDDPDADAEGEDEYPESGQNIGDGVQHKRENSEDLREIDGPQKEGKDEDNTSKAGGGRKRKRNRTVL